VFATAGIARAVAIPSDPTAGIVAGNVWGVQYGNQSPAMAYPTVTQNDTSAAGAGANSGGAGSNMGASSGTYSNSPANGLASGSYSQFTSPAPYGASYYAGSFALSPLEIANLFAPLIVIMAMEAKKGCSHGSLIVVGAGIWAFVICVRYSILIIVSTSFTAAVHPAWLYGTNGSNSTSSGNTVPSSSAAALPLVCVSVWIIWVATILTTLCAFRLGVDLLLGEPRACCNGNPNCGMGVGAGNNAQLGAGAGAGAGAAPGKVVVVESH